MNELQLRQDASGNFANAEGVTIRPKGFGTVDAVRTYMNYTYFGTFIDYLVKEYGYTENLNVIGAPYDWRYGGNEDLTNGVYESWKQLIEKTYEKNGQVRVHLLGHSMGAPIVHFFLARYVSQEWKDKYIGHFWGLGGAWAGAPISIAMLMNIGAFLPSTFTPPQSMVNLLQTLPSTVWMVPRPTLYSHTDPLVITPDRSYTVLDLPEILPSKTLPIYQRYVQMGVYDKVEAPGVNVTCIHGYGRPTPGSFTFASSQDLSKQKPQINFIDGDDTVPGYVLNLCKEWDLPSMPSVDVIPLFNVTHNDIVRTPEVWPIIAEGLVERR
jgi:lysophospholipase-3